MHSVAHFRSPLRRLQVSSLIHTNATDRAKLFDAFELRMLTLISEAQSSAHEWAVKAQHEYDNDTDALYAYVEHMAQLSHSRAYITALWEYRQYSLHKLITKANQ